MSWSRMIILLLPAKIFLLLTVNLILESQRELMKTGLGLMVTTRLLYWIQRVQGMRQQGYYLPPKLFVRSRNWDCRFIQANQLFIFIQGSGSLPCMERMEISMARFPDFVLKRTNIPIQ